MQKKIMKVLLLFSAVNLVYTVEQDAVDCSNTELVTSIFNEPIDLTFVGTIQIYFNVNINNITTTKNNDFDTNYIDARLEQQSSNNTKSLVIFTTPNFPNYAKEQSNNRITLRIILGCEMGRQRTVIFYQPFKEGNYYSPVFSQSIYELVVPMPLFAGFDLSAFAIISASDDDLTDNELYFSSNESAIYHIAVSTKSEISADKKTYFANLTLERIYLSLAAEISFKITATDNGNPPLSSEATIILRADPLNSLPPTPRFTQLVYSATLNDNLTMLPLEITLQLATYSLEVNFSKMGRDEQLFRLERKDNVLAISLLKALNEADLINKTILEFEIKAENPKLAEFGQTAVIIMLPLSKELPSSVTGESIFEQAWQVGRVEVNSADEQVLSLNVTKLRQNIEVNEYVFTLEGVDAQYFAVTVNASAKEVNLMLLQPISNELIESRTQLQIIMHAIEIADSKIRSSVLIFLELPRKDCATVSTPTNGPPRFASNSYIFSAKPNQLGSIGLIAAKTETNASIRYSLSAADEQLAARISITPSTGNLTLLSYVSPGIYYFNITAQNVETLAEASVQAHLLVDSLIQCEEQQPHVAATLLIKYIEEEKEHKDIMITSLDECQLQIFSMFPNDKAYVSINESTKMLNTIAIDREDPIFADMAEPQIQVKLKLNCNSTAQSLPQLQQRTDNYSLTLNQDIPFTRDITMLTLIIVDINDNAPKFLYPAKPTHLGYPEPSICLELFPEYLTQLKAYDRDNGLNAKIRYSMRPNAHFAIDAVSGIIYPKSEAFQSTADDETTLIVTATDRDGDLDGLTTAAVLFVKRLSAAHFTLLTFQTPMRQELRMLLQQLALGTKYVIESIKTATLPGSTTKREGIPTRRFRRDILSQDTMLQKVWVYALQADAPVNSVDFKRRLALISVASNATLMAETYAEVGLASNSTLNALRLTSEVKSSNAGYIVAISVMSLALSLLLCFLLWHFCLQKACHQRKSSIMSKLKDESELTEKPIKNSAYVEEYLNSLPASDRASITIRGSTTQESYSDDVKQSMQEAKEHVAAPNGKTPAAFEALQPRLQVKFNELVERIHIAEQPEESIQDEKQQK